MNLRALTEQLRQDLDSGVLAGAAVLTFPKEGEPGVYLPDPKVVALHAVHRVLCQAAARCERALLQDRAHPPRAKEGADAVLPAIASKP